MDYSKIIVEIDSEIARLQQARSALADLNGAQAAVARGPGRRGRRGKLSAAARARISAAQKARWARVRAKKK